MPKLERLRPDHASAVLDFELTNRAYFAASISDRGDEFFEQYSDRHDSLLREQLSGAAAYHLLLDDELVLGRFNLLAIEGGSANLGYRVAERAAGRGLATAAVRELCWLAAEQYGLDRIRAATSLWNVASQKVLANNGFVATGPAQPAELGGKPGTWYERRLSTP